MIEQDTVRLLRECDAGVKMGISSIDSVIDRVSGNALKKRLSDCKDRHDKLDSEIQSLLDSYGDEGKNPGAVAKGMSKMKTDMFILMDSSDEKISDLMTDGCNMGVKYLSKYLNRYKAADERSKDIAKRLISLEETLAVDLREFL